MLFGVNTTVLALIGLVGFAFAAGLYALFYSRIESGTNRDKRLDRFTSNDTVQVKSKSETQSARRRNVQDTLKDIEAKRKSKASRSTSPGLKLRIQQAGMKISLPQFIMISAVSGVVVFALLLLKGFPLMLCVGGGFVGGFGLPRFVVNYRRKKRQAAFTEELPNAVEVIVRGVKAGLPLNDCLRMIAAEAREPVRSEFRNVVDNLAVGIPMDEAVGRVYERMPLPEANFFAIVLAIQSKAGGNLSEALGNLAKVLRERKKMRGKIQAMSMEAKASASIIGSLPIVVAILVYLTSPAYISILWTTPTGQIVLGASALVMFTGIMVMRQMINFDF